MPRPRASSPPLKLILLRLKKKANTPTATAKLKNMKCSRETERQSVCVEVERGSV